MSVFRNLKPDRIREILAHEELESGKVILIPVRAGTSKCKSQTDRRSATVERFVSGIITIPGLDDSESGEVIILKVPGKSGS